ncbi:MAG: DoxX family protein [Candidatus Omnitrophica bacterium]|jgi:putative oxidoreductase|nr:DoxX family protein [Candidatus Omnitrophota bacterium]
MIDSIILILRICLAIVFLGHGLQAAFGVFSGPGIDGFSKMLSSLGFKAPVLWAYVSAYTQLVAGIFLLIGFCSRFAAFSILIFMLVAVLKVHASKGFFIQAGGFEYNFVIICICIILIMTGSGKFGITPKL